MSCCQCCCWSFCFHSEHITQAKRSRLRMLKYGHDQLQKCPRLQEKENKAKVVLREGRTTLVFSHPAVSSFGSFGALQTMAVTSPGVRTLLCNGSWALFLGWEMLLWVSRTKTQCTQWENIQLSGFGSDREYFSHANSLSELSLINISCHILTWTSALGKNTWGMKEAFDSFSKQELKCLIQVWGSLHLLIVSFGHLWNMLNAQQSMSAEVLLSFLNITEPWEERFAFFWIRDEQNR